MGQIVPCLNFSRRRLGHTRPLRNLVLSAIGIDQNVIILAPAANRVIRVELKRSLRQIVPSSILVCISISSHVCRHSVGRGFNSFTFLTIVVSSEHEDTRSYKAGFIIILYLCLVKGSGMSPVMVPGGSRSALK